MSPETGKPAARIMLEVPVEFRRSYSRRNDNAVLKNISISGAYLELSDHEALSVNDKLNVRFTVSGREREVIAKVIWKGINGCGIQFSPQNNRDVQIVDDLMYFVESRKETRKIVLESIFKKVS